MILRKRLITRYQLRKRSIKEDLTAVHIFLNVIYLSKSKLNKGLINDVLTARARVRDRGRFHKARKKQTGGQPWLHLQCQEASREQN